MENGEPWFIADRAEKQAVLLWTDLPVLIGQKRSTEIGPDLRILIDPEKTTVAEFGVEVKGALDLRNVLTNAMYVRADLQANFRKQVTRYEFPVALMVVDIKTTETYFGWLLAPSSSKQSDASLQLLDRTQVELATIDRLANAAEEVRRWYGNRRAPKRRARSA